jgi:hypothetical protein
MFNDTFFVTGDSNSFDANESAAWYAQMRERLPTPAEINNGFYIDFDDIDGDNFNIYPVVSGITGDPIVGSRSGDGVSFIDGGVPIMNSSYSSEEKTITLTTSSNGTATGYTTPINGRILSIQYVKTDFVDGVDFAITTETTAQQLWAENDVNASVIKTPRQPVHSTTGEPLEYVTGFAVVEPIAVDDERIKITIANGGEIKSGTFRITVDQKGN